MKHLRKVILILLGALSVCALAFFAACGGDSEGDSDPQTVAYTTEIYLAEGGDYVLSEEKSGTGAGEVGKTISLPAPKIDGYEFRADHAQNVTSLTLSANAADNVFRFYYDVKIEAQIVYQANAPQGAAVRGNVASTPFGSDGTATAAENGFSATGFRFAGWSYTKNGAATVQPGDTVTGTGAVTLYAVWDKGYTDRFGGTDYIYVLSVESGKVVLERGETELAKTDLTDDVFTFTLPNGERLEGKIFGDGTFAYARENLAGEYAFHTSYYNKDTEDGETPPDPDTTLTLDKFGNATYEYLEEDGAEQSSTGYISLYRNGESPEYIFHITAGADAGGILVFRLGVYGADELPVYTTTNGEAGTYDLYTSPNGFNYYGGDGYSIQLDGYGRVTMMYEDYTGEWEGAYWIEGIYDFNDQYNMYKLHLRVNDDENGNLRYLTGAVENGILEVSCYTTPLENNAHAYVEPNEEAGEYQSADGATLTLDGFKIFDDSARYVVGDEAYYGTYEAIWSQTGSKLTIVMQVYAVNETLLPLGREFTFDIDLTLNSNGSFAIGNTFSVVAEQSEGTPYRLLGSTGFGNTLLIIYNEDYTDEGSAVLGKRASYGTVNALGTFQKLAEGYVTKDDYAPLYTFTRVSLTGEEDGTVPKSMIFELGATYDSNFFVYNVYFVYSATYERNGADEEVKNYTELLDENEESGAKIWYMTLPVQGFNAGALYFREDGAVYTGTFSTQVDYFGPVGIFTVLGSGGNTTNYFFELQLSGSDSDYSSFTEITELEYPVYGINHTGTIDTTAHLILRGGEGLYSVSGDFDGGDFIHGTVSWVGDTDFSEAIFVFKSDDREILRYVMESMIVSEPGFGDIEISVYYVYDASVDKKYTAADGSSLTLDGYRSGTYTVGGETYRGTYTLSGDKKIVYFSAGGRNFTFDVSNGLTVTDGIYGTYEMFVGDEWWDIEFDGRGNATATLNPLTQTGIYLVQDDGTVLLFINGLDPNVTSYRLQLASINGNGVANIYDENVAGAFIGDDWTILYLDGFDSGSYYYPDGVGWSTVYFEILDADHGFVNVRTESYETWNVILDFAEKTMTYPEYVDRDYIYYAEDFSAIIVRETGEIEMNYTAGSYIFAGGVYKAFLMNSAGTYSVDLGSMPPEEGPWTVDGKTYYPAEIGQDVTLTGSITVENGDIHETKDAKLTFKITGEAVMRMEGFLTYDGRDYDVNLISTYIDGTGRKGLSVVDWSSYDYSPITSYSYQGGGKGTFSVTIKRQETTFTDAYERENGITSTLSEYRVGFGPLDFAPRTLSGNVYVGNGQYLKFDNAEIEPTDYFETDMGRRYNAVFAIANTMYSLQYSKESANEFSLYLIGTYERIEAEGGYSVGVIRYYYSNDAYEHSTSERGVFCDFILYDANGSIVSFSRAVNTGRTSGWYVALEGYDPETQQGYPETIYLVEFENTLKKATVTAYGFRQGADGDTDNFANLCLNENKEIADIAMVCIDGEFRSVESFTKNADGSYTIELQGGESYLMRVSTDENGDPLTYSDGNWQITLTAVSAD